MLQKPGIEYIVENLRKKEPISFRIKFDESFVTILGERIQLGPMTRYFRGNWDAPYQDVKQWIDHAGEEDSFEMVIEDAQVREEFENWPGSE